MIDYNNGNKQGVPGQPGTKAPGSYSEKLQALLAKAGQGAKRAGSAPGQPVPQNGTPQAVTAQPATAPQAQQPMPQAQGGYGQRLQAILAAAGGQALPSATAAASTVAGKAQNALNSLKAAAVQDPSKILEIADMEFDPNDGDEYIYLKCAGQAAGGAMLYHLFGCDIEHMLPDVIVQNYEAVATTYYRNIPEDVLLAEFAKASGMGQVRIF